MSVKRETPLRTLHMGCGESLVARVSLAMRYLERARIGSLARRKRPQLDAGRR